MKKSMQWILSSLLCATCAVYGEDSPYPQHQFLATTFHTIELESGPLEYSAVVGSFPIRDEHDKEKGNLFYVAFYKEGVEDLSLRPITFVFNGGPSGPSTCLMTAGYGPRRYLTCEEGQSLVPPYQLVDNPDTLLDLTDLVFIDPMSTGFSRASPDGSEEDYHDVWSDLESLSDAIYDLITLERRWQSPKYIAGVSYGTFRASGLAAYLRGIRLNGLILDSCAMDYQTLVFSLDNELPYALFIPTFAATAWYHGRLNPTLSLEDTVEQARHFALDTFAPALLKYGRVPKKLYPDLAYWTGLPLSYIEQQDGLIDDFSYVLTFSSPTKQVISRVDGRLVGEIFPPRDILNYVDPIVQQGGISASALHTYLHDELECEIDWPRYSQGISPHQWRWPSFGYPNVMELLRHALVINPSMRIFAACGYYDLATPFAAAEHSLQRLHLPVEKNVTFGYYECGHGASCEPPHALKQFKADMVRFYQCK